VGITSQRSKFGMLKNCCRTKLHFAVCNCEVAPKLVGAEYNSVLTAKENKGNNFVVVVMGAFPLGMEGPEFYSTMTHKEIVI